MYYKELSDTLNVILEEARDVIEQCSPEKLAGIKPSFLGRKGKLAKAMKLLGQISPEQKRDAGKLANQVKEELEKLFTGVCVPTKVIGTQFDVTLPGRKPVLGGLHPIRQVLRETIEVFYGMGFSVVEGPEIETEYYNFDALNTPDDHPARDIQDTFYLPGEGWLLRTQTSPVQIRVMESQKPPVRVIVPGRCFRRDAIDPTHYYAFHQCEGLYVDKDVTLADLKGVLTIYAQRILGSNAKIRFRPHFFPFTEPSVEYDFSCPKCDGSGCRMCKGTGWLEISGAGMVDPEVLKAVGYDPDIYQGYAWGMGIERVAMVKYGIDDIRLLYENDMAFLRQFR